MRRSLGAMVVGLLGLVAVGCAPSLPPEPLWPPPPDPIAIVDEPRPVVVESDRTTRADEATRQGALHVFASEQRAVLAAMKEQRPFIRTAVSTRSRLRSVLAESERDLESIEREIARIENDDTLSFADRHGLQDEAKDRLRRLATRLSRIEGVMRER